MADTVLIRGYGSHLREKPYMDTCVLDKQPENKHASCELGLAGFICKQGHQGAFLPLNRTTLHTFKARD